MTTDIPSQSNMTWAPLTTGKRSTVAIVKGTDPSGMTREALRLLGGISTFVKPGQRVFLKPNLTSGAHYTTAITTDPRFVAELIKMCKEAEASEVIVGENCGRALSTREAAKGNGMEEMCTKAGVDRFAWFEEEEEWEEIEIPDALLAKKFYVPKVILESDVIIDIPALKNNFAAVTTIAFKNWLGFVPYDKVRIEPRVPNLRTCIHRGVNQVEMAYYIADLMKHPKLNPALTLVTAIYGLEGYGPHSGHVINMDCCFAGKDPVATEAVAIAATGRDPLESPHCQVAHFRGLGTANLDEIVIKGNSIEDVMKSWKPATLRYINGNPNVDNYCGGVCGGCVWAYGGLPLHSPPDFLFDPKKKYAVLVGRRILIPENFDIYDELWLCGDCALLSSHQHPGYNNHIKRFREQGKKVVRLPGCPPHEYMLGCDKYPQVAKQLANWGFSSEMNPHTDWAPPNRPDLRTKPLGARD